MASDEDNVIREQLERVLAPLGEERVAEVVAWATEHLEKCPLVAYCVAAGEEGDSKPETDAKTGKTVYVPMAYEFRLGAPNPLDPENTIFAMFHWFVQGAVVVYSFKAAMLEDGSGGALAVYSRDVVFQPRFLSGPVTLEGLYQDLNYHTDRTPWDDVEEPDGPAPSPARPRPAPPARPGASS